MDPETYDSVQTGYNILTNFLIPVMLFTDPRDPKKFQKKEFQVELWGNISAEEPSFCATAEINIADYLSLSEKTAPLFLRLNGSLKNKKRQWKSGWTLVGELRIIDLDRTLQRVMKDGRCTTKVAEGDDHSLVKDSCKPAAVEECSTN